ncbi:MAG: FAD-binding oxidoreductase [Acidobacteria bacterium]|nr:FAD-binding oxidoreductase [Acidobacteriota bacterium]
MMITDVARMLQRDFRGQMLFRDSPGFAEASAIWNAMAQRTPGLILKCAGTDDVQRAVRAAAAAGLPVAIRCGGHSLAGFSTCEGGVVIDLAMIRSTQVDPSRRTARVQGGCLLGDIDSAGQRAGLAFPAGVVSHTGAAGLILGGGTGWLTRRYGLSCDNVLEFEVITAEGAMVRASAAENGDLFWALRGGGGNFGVVTAFQLQMHPLRSVVLATATCEERQMAGVLRSWGDFMAGAPDELKWNISLAKAANGRPALNQTIIWAGDGAQGEKFLRAALAAGSPANVNIREMPYLALQTMADADFPHGQRYYTKSGYFHSLSGKSVETMLQKTESMPSRKSQIELAFLGGASSRVGPGETAFGDRSAPILLNILGQWCEPANDAENVSWVRSVFGALRPGMAPGVYVNFMSGDEQDRVREAYRTRWDRLLQIKQAWDPNNFFCRNQNIPGKI